MRNMKKIAAILSYVQITLNMLYSVLFTPFVLRALGQSEYGVYTLCTSVISYLGMFQFGFGTTYMRYSIKYTTEGKREKAEELNGMFLEIFAIITLAVLVTGIILIANIELAFGAKITPDEYGIARTLLKFVVLNAALSTAGAPFSAQVTAHEEFVFQKLLALLEMFIKVAVLFPLLMLGYRSIALMGVSTLLSIITFSVNLLFVFGRLKVCFRFTHFDFALFKEMGVFSFFIFLQGIMDMFNWQTDRILLARFWGTKEISVYSVGAQVNSVYISLVTAITHLFVPKANRLIAEGQKDSVLTDLMIRIGRVQFLICAFLLSAFVFFGRAFLQFYAGPGYESAYWVTILLIAPLVTSLSMDLWYHIARAKGKHKTSTSVFCGVAFLNLLVSIPLCREYGEVGAAAGTCIGIFVANNVFQIWYAHKVVKLDMKRWAGNMLRLMPSLVPPMLAGTAISLLAEMGTIPQFLLWCVVYMAVSAVSFWLFALNREEKDLLAGPFLRIRGKMILKKGRR